MKAILTFNLPKEEFEHKAALAGLDALLLIDDILNEIRSYRKYTAGEFAEWKNTEGEKCKGDYNTLEKVAQLICELRQQRNLPEVI